MASIVPAIIIALSAGAALQAQALQILSLSPQGEVAEVRQVVARFDEAAVNFGDPKAPAPLALRCSDTQAAKVQLVNGEKNTTSMGGAGWPAFEERSFESLRSYCEYLP